MKQPKIRIAGIEESQLKGLEHIFNRVIEKNFLNLKKEMHITVQKNILILNILFKKRKSLYHIIIKSINIKNKRILKTVRKHR